MSVTFCIPVKIDSPDRERNLSYLLKHLTTNNYRNIIVCEIDSTSKLDNLKKSFAFEHVFIEIGTADCNHKCRSINRMIDVAKTDAICIQDVDCLIPVPQIESAILAITKNDFVYPYGGEFYNVPGALINENIYTNLNIDFAKKCNLLHPSSVGGSVFFNKKYLASIGRYNENFKSWGYEDNEIVTRALKLGARGSRVQGPIFHLDHSRGADSSPQNPFYKQNEQEYIRINNMPAHILREEVKRWSWA